MKSIVGLLCGQVNSASIVTQHCFVQHHCALNRVCAMDPTLLPMTVWELYLKAGPIVRSHLQALTCTGLAVKDDMA